MPVSEYDKMSPREIINELWGAEVLEVIDRQRTVPMTIDEFMSNHCISCGGNWLAMLITGIKDLYPEVYDAIPDQMGEYAFFCTCRVLELLQIGGDT